MKTNLKLALIGTASVFALSACDGGGSSYTPPPPPPGPTALEDNFGTAFGALFRAGANTDPADPTANSVIAVSLITDPVPVP